MLPQYYNLVGCPMYFGLVAARYHATKLLFPDVPVMPENPEENLFLAFDPSSYGSLFDHTKPLRKVPQLATFKKVEVLGEKLFDAAPEQPIMYGSVLEMFKDLMQIGANCLYFNFKNDAFVKIAREYFDKCKALWSRYFPEHKLPAWIFSGCDPTGLVPTQLTYKNNGYRQLTVHVVESTAPEKAVKIQEAAAAQPAVKVQSAEVSVVKSKSKDELIALCNSMIDKLVQDDNTDILEVVGANYDIDNLPGCSLDVLQKLYADLVK